MQLYVFGVNIYQFSDPIHYHCINYQPVLLYIHICVCMKHLLNKTLLSSGALASLLLSVSLTSCQDEEFGYTTQDIRDAVYARNFEKMYGKIAEDQIWDFSSYNLKKLGLTGGPSNDLSTRAVPNDPNRATTLSGLVTTEGDYYRVTQATINWLNENLTEKVPHDDLVNQSFSLSKVAGNDFYIVPIYQGQSGMIWDLELVDDKGRHLLWSKSDNFNYNYDFENRWEEYFYETGKDTYYESGPNKGLKFGSVFSIAEKENLSWAKMVFVIPPTLKSVTGRFVAKPDSTDTYTQQISDYWFSGFDGHQSTTTQGLYNGDYTFTFTKQGNPIINPDGRTLFQDGNQIDLTRLLRQYWYIDTKGHVVGHHLENLAFEITSYEKADPDSDTNATFYTWADDLSRIKVFVKYDGSKNDVTLSNQSSDAYVKGHTISKHDIDTKVLTVHSDKISGDFHFNLHTTDITTGDKGYAAKGDNHESTNGYMDAITHFSGTDVINKTDLMVALNARGAHLTDTNFEYMVLGCEDADTEQGKGGDRDYNDVVFLVVGGPKLPEINDNPIKKRYMIEDLGSTFDFDFNDIVVDVTEEHVRKLGDDTKMKIRQSATIRHLCGTIPFKVFLGTKSFGEKPMFGHNDNNSDWGVDPTASDYTIQLHSDNDWRSTPNDLTTVRRDLGIWDPDANNIKVYVWPGKKYDETEAGIYWEDYAGTVSSDGTADKNEYDSPNHVYEPELVQFPDKGTSPYIIATEPTVSWMKELSSIPSWWIKTIPVEYNDYNNNSGDESEDYTILTADFSNGSTAPVNGTGVSLSFSGNAAVENGALKLTTKTETDDSTPNNWDTALTIAGFDRYERGTEFEISFDYWTTTGDFSDIQNFGQAGAADNYATAIQSPLGALNATSTHKTVKATINSGNTQNNRTLVQISVQLNADKETQHVFYFDNFKIVRKK